MLMEYLFTMKVNQNKIRSFIAIELPEHIVSAIHGVQKGIKSHGLKLRWVKPENIHLTLKFLGDIDAEDVDGIGETVTSVAGNFSTLSLYGKGVGVFPNLRRPKVMWVGIGGETRDLMALQKNIDENFENIGFPKEKRAFKGHLTIGRAKGHLNYDRLVATMREFLDYKTEPFTAREIILFKSDLKPGGAVYTKLMTIPFKS